MICYTPEQFDVIKSGGFQYKVSQETIDIIQLISTQVGAPTYVRTPTFSKRDRKRNPRTHDNMPDNLNEPYRELNFQASTNKINSVTPKSNIQEIRIILNKMTEKNYDTCRDKILVLLEELLSVGDTSGESCESEYQKVCEFLFQIASNNKFYSKIYANLYGSLVEYNTCFAEMLDKSIGNYMSLFHNISFVSADEDYDKFCDFTKENEKRRALSTFMMEIVKTGTLNAFVIENIIYTLHDNIENSINELNKTELVCELSSNSIILIGQLFTLNPLHTKIVDYVKTMKSRKAKDYTSLSSRTVYQYMDLYDKISS